MDFYTGMLVRNHEALYPHMPYGITAKALGCVVNLNDHFATVETCVGSYVITKNGAEKLVEEVDLSGDQRNLLALLYYYNRVDSRGVVGAVLSSRAQMVMATLGELIENTGERYRLNSLGRAVVEATYK